MTLSMWFHLFYLPHPPRPAPPPTRLPTHHANWLAVGVDSATFTWRRLLDSLPKIYIRQTYSSLNPQRGNLINFHPIQLKQTVWQALYSTFNSLQSLFKLCFISSKFLSWFAFAWASPTDYDIIYSAGNERNICTSLWNIICLCGYSMETREQFPFGKVIYRQFELNDLALMYRQKWENI